MFNRNYLRAAALLFSSLSFSVFSLNNSGFAKSEIPDFFLPGVHLPVVHPGKILAKKTAGTRDTLLVSRSDNYSWFDNVWMKSDYDLFSYDQAGRPTQTASYTIDDSLSDKSIFTFDPDGRTVRTTLIMEAASLMLYGSDTTVTVTSYYPSIKHILLDYSNNIFTTGISEELAVITEHDSVKTTQLAWNAGSSTFDTIATSTLRYFKITEDSIVAAITMSSSIFGTDGPFDYKTTYSFARSTFHDTLTADIIVDPTNQSSYAQVMAEMDKMVMISNKDQYGRVIEQTMRAGTKESILGEIRGKYLTSYSENGTVASIIYQEWDTLSAAWVNSTRNVYTYTPVTLSARTGSGHISATRPEISATRKNRSFALTPGPGVSITSATVFDLNGRAISKFDGNAAGTVSLPLTGSKNMVAVVRVTTNCGAYVIRGTMGE